MENMVKKENLLSLINDNIKLEWIGTCTWRVSALLFIQNEFMEVYFDTNDEEYSTGIFDGSRFNTLCGYASMEELESIATAEGMTVEEFQVSCWSDSANEDNYEPREKLIERCAQALLEIAEEKLINEYNISVSDE